MKLNWVITNRDITLVQNVCSKHRNHLIFKRRLAINCKRKSIRLRKEFVWKCFFLCLLSTQQKSDDKSAINRFLKHGFSPLSIKNLKSKKNLKKFIQRQLSAFGGIRRNERIAAEAVSIFKHLNGTGWAILKDFKRILVNKGNRIRERELANKLVNDLAFKGIGPKQSRNLLQLIGLTQYEIPIDSRVFKWLNSHHIFPFEISSRALSDNNFYCFLNDLLIQLSIKAGYKPCLMDAAIFIDQSRK